MRKVTSKLEIPCGCQINLNYKYISSDMLTNNTNIISNRVFFNTVIALLKIIEILLLLSQNNFHKHLYNCLD